MLTQWLENPEQEVTAADDLLSVIHRDLPSALLSFVTLFPFIALMFSMMILYEPQVSFRFPPSLFYYSGKIFNFLKSAFNSKKHYLINHIVIFCLPQQVLFVFSITTNVLNFLDKKCLFLVCTSNQNKIHRSLPYYSSYT